MRHLFISSVLLFVFHVVSAGNDPKRQIPHFGDDDLELIFVTVLYRHGDRTPIDVYPTDPYKDPSNW